MKNQRSFNPLYYLWGDFFQNEKGKETIRQVLKNNILFKTLTRRELSYVEKIVHLRDYRPNEPIFKQNDKGIGMYIIAEGSISIKVHTLDAVESTTSETLVTVLKKGSFFGEMALIGSESKRTASAYANEYTTLIGFFRPDLFEIIDKKPALGTKIMMQLARVLGRRISETTEKITELKKEIKIQMDKETNLKKVA